MGVAAIEGLQGDSFLIGRPHVVATAKHFAVHGQPEGGTNTAPGNYSERIIRENFLVPFQVAVEEAKVGSVMASYNEIDGIPSHVNPWLLNRVLREEWGFRGYVTSDGDGLQMLIQTHHVAGNKLDAAVQAIAAGVDYDLPDGSVYRILIAQVKQGTVPESDVDRAVARVLATKFRLGLFDNPYVDPDYAEKTTNSPEHRQIALKAAQETIVLLKNDRNLLPLDLSKLKTIAVIGPNGAEVPQLYIHQKVASVTRPVMQLKGFQRTTLKSGEKKIVEFTITPDMLSMLNRDMHRVVEPGIFEIMVGPSSDQTNTVSLAVVGARGETGMPPLPPPPAGSESGIISTFDDMKIAASYGSWISTTDAENGGKSTGSMQVVDGGASNCKGALRVSLEQEDDLFLGEG
jgi:beta-glucosidase-like glycosyl hydrolase